MAKYYRKSTHFDPPFLYVSNSSVTKEYKLRWKGNHFDDINSLGKEGKHQTIAKINQNVYCRRVFRFPAVFGCRS